MISHTSFQYARKALAAALTLSLLAASTPAYAMTMWYCGIAAQAFADKNSWSVNDTCGANPAASPAADDTVILDKSAAGRVVVMSGAVSVKGLVLAKSFTGTLKQMSLLKIGSGSGGLKMGSGRFIGGPFPITLSGSLTMSGGIMSGLQNTFTMTGSLALSKMGTTAAGVGSVGSSPVIYSIYSQFTSTGTIAMAGSLANQNFYINSNVLSRLNNLKVNNRKGGTSDNIIVAASGSLALSGALTVTLGTLDLATKNTPLQVQRSVTVADSAQAEIMTDQNMTMSGAVSFGTAGLLTVSGGTLTLTGNHDQAVNIQGQRIYNLTINNNGSVVGGGSTDDDVTFAGGTLNMSGALAITLGNLDLLSNTLAAVVKGGGITVTNTAEASIALGGNLTMSGSLSVGDSAGFSIPLTATLKVNGVAANIDTNNTPLFNLTVDSASGARLTSPQRVYNRLQIGTGGTLSLVAFTLSATGASIKNYGNLRESTGKVVHSGSIIMTNAALTETSTINPPTPIYFVLNDADENNSGTSQDTVTVDVALSTGDSETVTLTETTNTSGVFIGSVTTGNGVGGTGVLSGTQNATITSTYTDAQDALVHTDTSSFVVFLEPTTSSNSGGTSGGGGGGSSGGGGGRSYLKSTPTTVPDYTPPVITPKTPTMLDGLTRREIAEKAKALRLEKRLKAAEVRKARAAQRKAKRGL